MTLAGLVLIVAALCKGRYVSPTASAHGDPISVAPQFVASLRSTPLGQANLNGNVWRRMRT